MHTHAMRTEGLQQAHTSRPIRTQNRTESLRGVHVCTFHIRRTYTGVVLLGISPKFSLLFFFWGWGLPYLETRLRHTPHF